MKGPVLAKRRLGRTNLYVTPLGLGGVWLGCTLDGPNEQLAVATVLRALELGINLIDTSPVYIEGESQRFIGLALEEWYKRGGRREDIVLPTKTGKYPYTKDYTAEGTRRSVEKSLELLKTDYLMAGVTGAIWTLMRSKYLLSLCPSCPQSAQYTGS